jgi:hypothetical protein
MRRSSGWKITSTARRKNAEKALKRYCRTSQLQEVADEHESQQDHQKPGHDWRPASAPYEPQRVVDGDRQDENLDGWAPRFRPADRPLRSISHTLFKVSDIIHFLRSRIASAIRTGLNRFGHIVGAKQLHTRLDCQTSARQARR